jgi:hypothetical protein
MGPGFRREDEVIDEAIFDYRNLTRFFAQGDGARACS